MTEDCAIIYLSSVEDAEAARALLSSYDVRCEVASSARELGVLIERLSPGFLVLDGPLADRSGVEALTWLRRGGLDISAVFLCGSSYEADALASQNKLMPFVTCRELTRELLSELLVHRQLGGDGEEDLPASGSLDHVDIAELLLQALRRRWTGRLVLESGGITKTIFIDSGMPVYCSSNILSENFGRLLLKRGVISQNDYDKAREIQLKERVQQGEALVKLGVLKRDDLSGYLHDQVREKLLNALAWSGGTFHFEPGDGFREKITACRINPIEVLIEGQRRFRAPRDARKRWPKLRRLWAVANNRTPATSALVHQVLPDKLRQALKRPHLLSELAKQQQWSEEEAVSVFTMLERAGYLDVAERAELLPEDVHPSQASEINLGQPPPRPDTGRTTVAIDYPTAEQKAALLEELYETYFSTASTDGCQLLGIAPSSPPDQIVKASDGMLKRFSDERYWSVAQEPKHGNALNLLRARIQEAASKLLDPKRHQFNRAETSQTRTTREVSMKKLVLAEEEFKNGMALLDDDPRAALAHFSRATELNGRDPLYLLYHGWCRYQVGSTPGERAKAEKMIRSAVDANPIMPDGHVLLAQVLLAQGSVDEAIDRARTALAFAPDNRKAMDMLADLGAPVSGGFPRAVSSAEVEAPEETKAAS